MIHRPELSERLSTWVVILSAYDIRYIPRNAMKTQTLANFIAKMTPHIYTSKPAVDEWQLWVNGACGAKGFGIEILL